MKSTFVSSGILVMRYEEQRDDDGKGDERQQRNAHEAEPLDLVRAHGTPCVQGLMFSGISP